MVVDGEDVHSDDLCEDRRRDELEREVGGLRRDVKGEEVVQVSEGLVEYCLKELHSVSIDRHTYRRTIE